MVSSAPSQNTQTVGLSVGIILRFARLLLVGIRSRSNFQEKATTFKGEKLFQIDSNTPFSRTLKFLSRTNLLSSYLEAYLTVKWPSSSALYSHLSSRRAHWYSFKTAINEFSPSPSQTNNSRSHSEFSTHPLPPHTTYPLPWLLFGLTPKTAVEIDHKEAFPPPNNLSKILWTSHPQIFQPTPTWTRLNIHSWICTTSFHHLDTTLGQISPPISGTPLIMLPYFAISTHFQTAFSQVSNLHLHLTKRLADSHSPFRYPSPLNIHFLLVDKPSSTSPNTLFFLPWLLHKGTLFEFSLSSSLFIKNTAKPFTHS